MRRQGTAERSEDAGRILVLTWGSGGSRTGGGRGGLGFFELLNTGVLVVDMAVQ